MHRQSQLQLAFVSDKSPSWDTLSPERQVELQEVISLLLEKSLQQDLPTAQNPSQQIAENAHV